VDWFLGIFLTVVPETAQAAIYGALEGFMIAMRSDPLS
jgi:hypothetical protein